MLNMAYPRKLYQTMSHSIFNTVQNVCNRMIFFTLPAASNFPSLIARLKEVNAVKSLLKKAEDPYGHVVLPINFLKFWFYSPVELSISYHLCANLPIIQSQLQPSIPDFCFSKLNRRKRRGTRKECLTHNMQFMI